MNTKPLLIVIVLLALLVIGFLVFAGNDADDRSSMATTTPSVTTTVPAAAPSPAASGGQANNRVTVTYGTNGFSPATVTVSPGTTVTWVNEGTGRMWVGADVHPTHTSYDGTSLTQHCANGAPTSATVFDQCGAGGSYSFTFTKAGPWDYHNHANSGHGGTVVVR